MSKKIFGVLGFVVTITVTILIALGFFANADIRPVEQSSLNPCSYNVETSFKMTFMNVGERNEYLCVNVSSSEINFSKQFLCLFMPKEDHPGISFDFPIEISSIGTFESEKNITISANWQYKKNFFRVYSFNTSCRYKKGQYSRYLQSTGTL